MMKSATRILLLSVLSGWLLTSGAAEPPQYNRVSLQASASREVVNDWMQVQMSVEYDAATPAAVTDQINRTLNSALGQAKRFPAVKTSSGWQNTHPVYDKNNRLVNWHGLAQFNLESADFKAMSALIGQLENSMSLTAISFQVSPQTRRVVEDQLTGEALADFRHRADGIRQALGGTGYVLVQLNVGRAGGEPPRPLAMGRAAAMAAQVTPPEFGQGESQLTVQVSGTIEIRPVGIEQPPR